MSYPLPSGMEIVWLGHSTVLIALPSGKRILIDPWTHHNPSCPEKYKDPGHIDLILITHGHSDHMGDALALAKDSECTIACGYEIMLHLASKGIAGHRFQPMNIGGSIQLPTLGVTLTQTHAQHSGGIDEGEKVYDGGVAAGFVIAAEGCPTIWHMGDTGVFSDMRLIGELYQPEIVMLPIGDRFTMGPREAALALEWLPTAKAALPLHWGTFPPLTGTPGALKKLLALCNVSIEVLTPAPGEAI